MGWEITLRVDRVPLLGLLIMISPSSSSLLFLPRRFKTCTIIGAVCSLIDTDADFPHAGWTGSKATICCGIGWFGGKLRRYCKCLMYLIANLEKNDKKWNVMRNLLLIYRHKWRNMIIQFQHTLTIQFLIIVFREVYNMEVFLEVAQMTYSYLSFEPALDRKQIFCIALKYYER